MDLLKDLCGKLKLLCGIEMALVDKLEEMEKTQYKIVEDNKRITAVNRSLESRYSELLYAFGAYKKDTERFIQELQAKEGA